MDPRIICSGICLGACGEPFLLAWRCVPPTGWCIGTRQEQTRVDNHRSSASELAEVHHQEATNLLEKTMAKCRAVNPKSPLVAEWKIPPQGFRVHVNAKDEV